MMSSSGEPPKTECVDFLSGGGRGRLIREMQDDSLVVPGPPFGNEFSRLPDFRLHSAYQV